jgi:hypothetical protein
MTNIEIVLAAMLQIGVNFAPVLLFLAVYLVKEGAR